MENQNPITLADLDGFASRLEGPDLVIVDIVRRALRNENLRKSDLDVLDQISEEHWSQQTQLEIQGDSCPRLAEVWVALGLRGVCKRNWSLLPLDLLLAIKAEPKGELILE